ncbi:MAG: hypothetical protein AAB885_01360, partial [Patescibacteria group bacterium]
AFFFPSQFKKINVFFKVDELEGARRMKDRPDNQNRTLEEILTKARDRLNTERERYKKLYGIADHMDEKLFNVVIDTTELSADATTDLLLENLRALI